MNLRDRATRYLADTHPGPARELAVLLLLGVGDYLVVAGEQLGRLAMWLDPMPENSDAAAERRRRSA